MPRNSRRAYLRLLASMGFALIGILVDLGPWPHWGALRTFGVRPGGIFLVEYIIPAEDGRAAPRSGQSEGYGGAYARRDCRGRPLAASRDLPVAAIRIVSVPRVAGVAATRQSTRPVKVGGRSASSPGMFWIFLLSGHRHVLRLLRDLCGALRAGTRAGRRGGECSTWNTGNRDGLLFLRARPAADASAPRRTRRIPVLGAMAATFIGSRLCRIGS